MKKILIVMIGVFLLTSAAAIITLSDGSKIIGKIELAGIEDNQISTYMENSLQMTRYKMLDEKIIVYYNITYLEKTHSNYFDNSTNETINDTYKVFTQEKPFTISINLWNKCIENKTKQNCKTYLVDRETPYYLIENVSSIVETEIYDEYGNVTLINETVYEITNTTIKSTYLQAVEEQARQYERAVEFRDKAIGNDLEELFDLI